MYGYQTARDVSHANRKHSSPVLFRRDDRVGRIFFIRYYPLDRPFADHRRLAIFGEYH